MLADYAADVWPGFNALDSTLPVRLLTLRATTVAGLRAKAAAVLAMERVPGLDLRDDSWELARSVIEDAAGLLQVSA